MIIQAGPLEKATAAIFAAAGCDPAEADCVARHLVDSNILLSDGTGNAANRVWKSNVWRVFESLDLRGNSQIAIYNDGVGTYRFQKVPAVCFADSDIAKIEHRKVLNQ